MKKVKNPVEKFLEIIENRKKDPCHNCGVKYAVNCKADNKNGTYCIEKK